MPLKLYQYDRNFFKKIDSDEKAYVLGLLYADGNVINSQMQLWLNDVDLLENVRFLLKSNHPIKNYKRQPKIFKYMIGSIELVDDLIKLGCVPNKSLILKFPTEDQVPEKFIGSFMLGYFDGDGSISIFDDGQKNPKWNFNIAGTESFCISFRDKLCKYCDLFKVDLQKVKSIFTVNFSGRSPNRIIKIYNFLYKNPEKFGLRRKLDKIKNYLSKNVRKYTSNYNGVCFHKQNKVWMAMVHKDKKVLFRGYFDQEILAAKAYDEFIIKNGLDKRKLNFPINESLYNISSKFD